MKVLFVDRAGAQSIWSLMDTLKDALVADGHSVHQCRWDEGGKMEDNVESSETDHRILVPPRRRPWDILHQHRCFGPAFADLLERVQPDVVHLNFIVPGGLAAKISKRNGVRRIIVTRHELAGSLSPHLRLWSAMTERFADHFVHVSSTVADSYGHCSAPVYKTGKPSRAVVIRNGIDVEALAAVRPFRRPKNTRTLVVPGRMVAVKGQDRALAAFTIAARLDPRLRLEFLGDGPDRSHLEATVGKIGIVEKVDFLGWLPRSEVLARMRSAYSVLVPSTQEGFGLALAEAMALNTPVIVSDIPVFREVSALGSGVKLVNTADANMLSKAILEPAARPTANSQSLDLGCMIQSYLNLYQ